MTKKKVVTEKKTIKTQNKSVEKKQIEDSKEKVAKQVKKKKSVNMFSKALKFLGF